MQFRHIAIAIALLTSAVGAHAGDAAAGKAKAAMCAACHGPNGVAAIPTYPNLAGQNAPYLEAAMKAYKNGDRKGGQAPVMTSMMASLSDADIANLAAYYSGL